MAGTGPVDVENITQALQGLVLKSLCVRAGSASCQF